MANATDIYLRQIRWETQQIAYRTPMKFGGRVVEAATMLHVTVDVETRDGRRGSGLGSMPMGNVWAWPSNQLSADVTLDTMVDLAQRLNSAATDYDTAAHPLDITTDLAAQHHTLATEVQTQRELPEPIPELALLVAASPLEAAIHDAYGKALDANSYDLLGQQFVARDLSHWLGSEFAGRYLDEFTTRQPKPQMPLYHLVGALDPLTPDDIPARLDDGLPETLGEWILADGLTHMKVKLNGDDLNWDVQRVVAIERVAAETQATRGCSSWFYSLDFNEKCQNVQYVLDFLDQLQEQAPEALARVQYIEQPTARDLRAHPENKMHAAAARKPVVIDESLVDLDSLLLSRKLGYSGVALKACKGHTEALLMGAAAQHYGLFLCVQDLTCPGASFLHSASLSCRIPTVAAIEGNGRQYCPRGNEGWSDRFPGMFRICDGTVETGLLNGPGLGY